jgi:hypothetical protein
MNNGNIILDANGLQTGHWQLIRNGNLRGTGPSARHYQRSNIPNDGLAEAPAREITSPRARTIRQPRPVLQCR